MNLYNSFVGEFFLLLMFTTGVASWVFRYSSVSTGWKMLVPSCLFLLAFLTPFRVLTLMGYPTPANIRDMPQRAELLAFLPYDDDKRVDLWLREGNAPPRAYDIILTPEMKKTLRQAQSEQEQGNRVMLAKRDKVGLPRQGYIDIDGGDAPYELSPDAFSLPPKGEPK